MSIHSLYLRVVLHWQEQQSESFCQTCRLITQAMNSSAIPEKALSIFNEKRDIPYQVFTKIMKQGQEENTIVDGNPEDLANLFWSTVDGLAIFLLHGHCLVRCLIKVI